jgi:hypothetical protein
VDLTDLQELQVLCGGTALGGCVRGGGKGRLVEVEMISIANRFCRSVLASALLGVALVLGGCVSAHKLDQALAIPVGMNEAQVANKVGQPVLKDRQEDGTVRWIWSREGQFGPESVTLVMKEGRVAAVESEGERLKHLEQLRELDRLLEFGVQTASTDVPESGAKEAVGGTVKSQTSNITNAVPVIATEEPVQHEKSSEEIWRERDEGLAEAQRQARTVEEQSRLLAEKAKVEATKAAEEARAAEAGADVPPFTAWYMARQFVSDKLAGKRRLFPNPRFAREAAGEERGSGNIWRAWGYVDTVDEANAPVRKQWTAELEFEGGVKWRLKSLAFGEK